MIDEQMNIVVVGHVDHGKSTIVGRLLADTGSLPDGKLESIRLMCERNSKPFEYAFLLDALKDEQSQGITIDAARVFFKTPKRYYIILDAPGHIEFLKNMITGAARAEAALLVIDAQDGVQENSRRHAYMLSMLGVKQVAVLINKMDLVDYEQKIYEQVKHEYNSFLAQMGLAVQTYIPVSGMNGNNIVEKDKNMNWYKGPSVLEALDGFEKEASDMQKPFRMYVQDIYKFTKFGDNRRIVVGSPVSGKLKIGDEIIFLPSGKKATVNKLESYHEDSPEYLLPEMAGGFTLNEQIYITRGEMAVKTGEAHPHVSSKFTANIFWLGKAPMVYDKDYVIKSGTSKVISRLEKINNIMDASTLKITQKDQIDRNDVAEVVLSFKKPLVFDLSKNSALTSRFVIVDNFEIVGGGSIRSIPEGKTDYIQSSILLRKYKWEKGLISMTQRAERFSQKPTLIVITGDKQSDKKTFAKKLEERLFLDGRSVYFIGIGNIKYGLDADIAYEENAEKENDFEHIRRLAETANILLDAGIILIVTATDLTQDDLEILKSSVSPDQIETIWVGDTIESDIQFDFHLSNKELSDVDCVTVIINNLKNKRLFFTLH